MLDISNEDMANIHESSRLVDKFHLLHKEWIDMLEKVRQGEMSLKETKPKYDEYLAAVEEWDKHRSKVILFEQVRN
ncbi:MAG: hypothetical protein QM652_06920 [Legionella sp.]|uniref:hypothetical protein n=1 Tax=Legionella sp. TaxID=459 RepID=UPI0039E63A78